MNRKIHSTGAVAEFRPMKATLASPIREENGILFIKFVELKKIFEGFVGRNIYVRIRNTNSNTRGSADDVTVIKENGEIFLEKPLVKTSLKEYFSKYVGMENIAVSIEEQHPLGFWYGTSGCCDCWD